MDTIKSYKDLCEEIEIWKWRVEAYKAEIKALKKLAKVYGPSDITGIDYSQPKVQSTNQIGFEEFLERLHKLENHIYIHEEAIRNMEKCRRKMEERIKRLEGIDKKVVYMRDIEGKTLVEIADKLGYSYDYIKEVSARNKRTHY
ncbi:RNA polymerase sigma factor sigma-70 region 4 domain-containing protein [Tepidimicrobium xylanilyticum]